MTNTEPSLGAVVSQRREDLDLSQVDLAWLARVSRNTISNMERGQGSPAGNTVARVAHALGGNSDAFSALASGPHEAGPGWSGLRGANMGLDDLWITEKPVAAAVLGLILNLNASESVIEARRAADAWNEVHGAKTVLISRGSGDFGITEGQLNTGLSGLRKYLLPSLGSDESSELIREWFQDHGWSPEDDLAEQASFSVRSSSRLISEGSSQQVKKAVLEALKEWEEEQSPSVAEVMETVAKILEDGRAELAAFRRLPIMVQRTLLASDFGDYTFFRPKDLGGASHILLTFTDREDPWFDQKKALDSHMNALVALDIATRLIYKTDSRNPTFEEVFNTVRQSLDLHGRGVRDPGGFLELGSYENADPEARDGSTE